MTSEKKSFLLGQLQQAIDEAVAGSGRIGEIVNEMRSYGYDLTLLLESTVTINPINNQESDAPEHGHTRSGEIELSDADRDFLRDLRVAA